MQSVSVEPEFSMCQSEILLLRSTTQMYTNQLCWPSLRSTCPLLAKKSPAANLIRSDVRGKRNSCVSVMPASARADLSACRNASAADTPRKNGGS